MKTIQIKVDYDGEVKLNGEFTTTAPFSMLWFPNNDLTVETKYEKIVYNSEHDGVITPRKPDKKLDFISNANIKLAKNNLSHYVIINDRFAYRLPNSLFESQ